MKKEVSGIDNCFTSWLNLQEKPWRSKEDQKIVSEEDLKLFQYDKWLLL